MGVRNYLIEGVSGAGKTTVAEELERRGHHVIHGDRKFAYHGNPETGEPVQVTDVTDHPETLAWAYARWIWPVDRVKAIIADRTHPMTFFCGGSRNSHHFINLFDAVFVLTLDAETLRGRVAHRGDDEFGGKPLELALVLRVLESGEGLPGQAIAIDSTRPVGEVVDDILSKCGRPL
jgi:thymidylate kinase